MSASQQCKNQIGVRRSEIQAVRRGRHEVVLQLGRSSTPHNCHKAHWTELVKQGGQLPRGCILVKDEVPDGSLKIIDFGSDWLHFGRGLKIFLLCEVLTFLLVDKK